VAEESPFSGSGGSDRRQLAHRQIAVAIEDRPGDKAAPRVVASGRGALAEQILQIAFDRGVKVRHDADLAEILATIEVESEIPLEALAAVAEILSYVYRTQSNVPPAKVAPARGASTKVTPARDASARIMPTRGASARGAPAGGASAWGAPAGGAPERKT
jgi:flagellar biosynthesis protein